MKKTKTGVSAVLKKSYERFVKIRGHPREIALGFALGIFIGMTPTMGFQIIIAVFFAALIKWNKISAAVGVWITNPITAPFIYSINYLIGAKLLGIKKFFRLPADFSLEFILKILTKAPEVLLALTIGGIIIGLPLAVLGYYFSYSTIEKHKESVKQKIAKQRERLRQFRKKRKKNPR